MERSLLTSVLRRSIPLGNGETVVRADGIPGARKVDSLGTTSAGGVVSGFAGGVFRVGALDRVISFSIAFVPCWILIYRSLATALENSCNDHNSAAAFPKPSCYRIVGSFRWCRHHRIRPIFVRRFSIGFRSQSQQPWPRSAVHTIGTTEKTCPTSHRSPIVWNHSISVPIISVSL